MTRSADESKLPGGQLATCTFVAASTDAASGSAGPVVVEPV